MSISTKVDAEIVDGVVVGDVCHHVAYQLHLARQEALLNVATEDVLYMLNGMDIETGVDMQKLLEAGQYINEFLGRESASRAALALTRK